ncbi:hypothetical protein BpHYR1_037168 [Brachionus plicatilis]|uniref:Uncharacterized protein n=1 Tax=Brachionus plicatilis TaxID=10195 RepID=A0A3M7RFE7_BRAPC|nr:hypothetical protein BpHYR1_037168 [Brachionus plicatilis]
MFIILHFRFDTWISGSFIYWRRGIVHMIFNCQIPKGNYARKNANKANSYLVISIIVKLQKLRNLPKNFGIFSILLDKKRNFSVKQFYVYDLNFFSFIFTFFYQFYTEEKCESPKNYKIFALLRLAYKNFIQPTLVFLMGRLSLVELDVLVPLLFETLKFLSDSSDIECCLRCEATALRPPSVESLDSADCARVPTTGISAASSWSVSWSLLLCSSSSVLASSDVRLSVDCFDSFRLSSLLLSSKRERMLYEDDVAGVQGLGVALVNGKRRCKTIYRNATISERSVIQPSCAYDWKKWAMMHKRTGCFLDFVQFVGFGAPVHSGRVGVSGRGRWRARGRGHGAVGHRSGAIGGVGRVVGGGRIGHLQIVVGALGSGWVEQVVERRPAHCEVDPVGTEGPGQGRLRSRLLVRIHHIISSQSLVKFSTRDNLQAYFQDLDKVIGIVWNFQKDYVAHLDARMFLVNLFKIVKTEPWSVGMEITLVVEWSLKKIILLMKLELFLRNKKKFCFTIRNSLVINESGTYSRYVQFLLLSKKES